MTHRQRDPFPLSVSFIILFEKGEKVSIIMGKKKTLEEWNDIFQSYHKNITIVKEVEKKNRQRYFLCHCSICNQEFVKPYNGYRQNCPICKNRKIIKGVNDIATTEPWTVKYFNNTNDAYTHSRGSEQRVEFKCPTCGKIKITTILDMTQHGFRCDFCSDKVSYPNKFSRAFLLQLPINNLIPEYSPKWIKPKRYDNYFEYNGNKYILEMDGGFHYVTNTLSGMRAEQSKEIDEYKDKQALLHNITVIRIDCSGLTFESIKQSIVKSVLSEIFDLSKIDWLKCDRFGCSNLLKTACEMYNNGERISDITKKLMMSDTSITRYLKIGNRIGITNYTPKNTLSGFYKNIDVYSEKDNSFIGTFHYYREAGKQLSLLNNGEPINERVIGERCRNKIHTPYKGYIFIERERTNE